MSVKKRTSGYHGRSLNSHEHGRTPPDLMDTITAMMAARGWLDVFDPCPNDPKSDGLAMDWPDDRPIYVNPPYTRGKIALWCAKCSHEARLHPHRPIVLLIPAYTDTVYFHDQIFNHDGEIGIHFFKGRLKFGGYERSASFPSVLIGFNINIGMLDTFDPVWLREKPIRDQS